MVLVMRIGVSRIHLRRHHEIHIYIRQMAIYHANDYVCAIHIGWYNYVLIIKRLKNDSDSVVRVLKQQKPHEIIMRHQ
jgi:hypothetical protein